MPKARSSLAKIVPKLLAELGGGGDVSVGFGDLAGGVEDETAALDEGGVAGVEVVAELHELVDDDLAVDVSPVVNRDSLAFVVLREDQKGTISPAHLEGDVLAAECNPALAAQVEGLAVVLD
jgi:hypothetical protein